jgi:hypothetical protein
MFIALGVLKMSSKCCFPFVFLCGVLRDTLSLNVLQLNTKDSKACTKALKVLFQQPRKVLKISKSHLVNIGVI